MNATITEPLQTVLDKLPVDKLPIDIGSKSESRSRTPVVFSVLLIAAIVAVVLMRRRGASDETAPYDVADAPVSGNAAFVDVR